MAHRIAHWFGWNAVVLLRIIHHPTCDGKCFFSAAYGVMRCDHKLELQCVRCGEIKII